MSLGGSGLITSDMITQQLDSELSCDVLAKASQVYR